jgi:hypothetical protein
MANSKRMAKWGKHIANMEQRPHHLRNLNRKYPGSSGAITGLKPSVAKADLSNPLI